MQHFANSRAARIRWRAPCCVCAARPGRPAARVPRRAALPTLPLLVLPLLLVLLGPTAGCASHDGAADSGGRRPAGSPRPSASPSPGGRPSGGLDERRLRTALLDLADFPTGWAVDSPRTTGGRGRGVPEPRDPTCRTLFSTTFSATLDAGQGASGARHTVRARAQASAGFLRSRHGPFLSTAAGAFRTVADARAVLTAFERAGQGCRTFQTRQDDRTVSYVAAPLDLPDLGDGSRAVRFRQQGEEEATVEVVLARVGPNLVVVAQAGREALADVDDDEGIEPLARRAVTKLRAVVQGRTPVPDGSHPGATDL